ncbi:MAG: phosphate signaling complex protein PhoU [Bdellovibrionaceae bacterium]|nr:phosphate signaling complex protein PhoU [Pseudobdellovibrionaceae bacterium]
MDNLIDEVKRLILIMGGSVEMALQEVTQAIATRNASKLKNIHQIEQKINEDHIKIDETCLTILAKQSPVAKDLRLILSVLKINTDLERMGDQVMNITYTTGDYLTRPPLAQVSMITQMGDFVRKMVKESLDCFVKGDADHSRQILLMDDEVDDLKNKVFRELCEHMKKNPQDVDASLDLILIARNLERLGDHATNIAEDVIFAFTGEDVRHGGKSGA